MRHGASRHGWTGGASLMGRASRLRRARREERLREEQGRPPLRREAFSILKGLHRTIQGHCHENSRRCWEYLLEMLAHQTGWHTESNESEHLWEPMCQETRFAEFYEAWMDEVQYAADTGAPFSEPLGELLEDLEATNDRLGQFFTPMSVVHTINRISMPETIELKDGRPTKRGLDPACGTGRFMIDALVHHPGLVMHAVDLDPWLLRAAKLNVRMLAKWTSSRIANEELLKPLDGKPVPPGHSIILGGRAFFIQGDALRVDLSYQRNWLNSPWAWTPYPWHDHLKINGYYGSLSEWEAEGRPPLAHHGDEPISYDFTPRSTKDETETFENRRNRYAGRAQ